MSFTWGWMFGVDISPQCNVAGTQREWKLSDLEHPKSCVFQDPHVDMSSHRPVPVNSADSNAADSVILSLKT